jgi:hypothetical protein
MRASLFVVCAWTPPPVRALAAPLAFLLPTIALTAAAPASTPSGARAPAPERLCMNSGERTRRASAADRGEKTAHRGAK